MTAPSPAPVEGANWTQIGAYQTYDDLLSANAIAIADNAARIIVTETGLTSQSTSITTLQNDLTDAENGLGANSLAIAAVQGRVTVNENGLALLSSDLSLVQNTLTDTVSELTATSSGLGLLESQVTQTGNTVTAQGVRIDQVEADVLALDVDGNAASLSSLTARVDQNEDDITAQGTALTQVQASVNSVSSAVQTKAEASVVTNLAGEVTGIKARYSIKLDVGGRMSGLIFGDNGTQSSLVVASNSMLFIDPGQSITPFNPATDYTSMDALRDTQLVFGYAKVEGQNRFVINAPAYIPEGYITSGQVGAIGFGKITDSNGQPVTTVAGKLKAENIDVDNLVAVQAQSASYSASVGWSLPASGDAVLNNARVRGHVEMNTGYIAQSVQIGGTSQNIGNVRQMAQDAAAGAALASDWVRPGYTLIDGNKIFAGVAYVDTLQIKGNAVSTAQYVTWAEQSAGGTYWKNLASLYYEHGDPQNAIKVAFQSFVWARGPLSGPQDTYHQLRMLVGGAVVAQASGAAFTKALPEFLVVSMNPGPQLVQIQSYGASTGGVVATGYCFMTGTVR